MKTTSKHPSFSKKQIKDIQKIIDDLVLKTNSRPYLKRRIVRNSIFFIMGIFGAVFFVRNNLVFWILMLAIILMAYVLLDSINSYEKVKE